MLLSGDMESFFFDNSLCNPAPLDSGMKKDLRMGRTWDL